MNFSALSKTLLFLCVLFFNRTLVLSLTDYKFSFAGSKKNTDNYSSLAKKAFESDGSSNQKKFDKNSYSYVSALAYELDYLSDLNTNSDKVNFATLSKLAFELADLSKTKKFSEDNFGSLVKSAHELDELSDLSKCSDKYNYASIAKLAFQLYDLPAHKKSDKYNYASLAKLAFESDEFSGVDKTQKRVSDIVCSGIIELFQHLKFYTGHTTSPKLHHSDSVNLKSYGKLRLMEDIQYNVESELGMLDFYFNPSTNCEMVSYNEKKIWENGDAEIRVPSTMTYDLEEGELAIRNNLRYLTYRKMANGSWLLKAIELLDTNEFFVNSLHLNNSQVDRLTFKKFTNIDDFVATVLHDKGFNIYTKHEDNLILVNNPETYQLSRIGKFRSVYIFKFQDNVKCKGVEYHGRKVWTYDFDDTPLLQDGYTKAHPNRIIFNTRANTIYVMFKSAYYVLVNQMKGYYSFKINLLN